MKVTSVEELGEFLTVNAETAPDMFPCRAEKLGIGSCPYYLQKEATFSHGGLRS